MRKLLLILFCIVFVSVSACAKYARNDVQLLTREEALKARNESIAATTRIFENVKKEDVLIAVDKIFRLCDGSDFKLNHTESAVTGSRRWSIYLVLNAVFGVDNWIVTADQIDDNVKVTVLVNSSATTIAVPLVGDTPPDINSTIPGNALYAVFFNRLGYLLGESTEWWDCETAKKKIKELGLNGEIDPLCHFTVKDDKLK